MHLVEATAAVKQGVTEQIRVEYSVHFQAESGEGAGPPLELGRATATAYYVRKTTGEFKLATSLSSAPKSVLDSIFDISDDYGGMTNEQFLKFDIVSLRRIASAPRSPEGQWLASFLRQCKDTPEKAALLKLLQP